MSWKSIVCTGLLCVLASPALAAPTMTVDLLRNGTGQPVLDASGNWQWVVKVDPDDALFSNPSDVPDRGTGGSVAVELGFVASGTNLVSGAKNATNFPSDNAGNSPFAAPINGIQSGIVTNGNNLFAALGSDFFGTVNFGGTVAAAGAAKEAMIIKTIGPSVSALTSTLTWSGAYTTAGATGGTNGRISQGGSNFNTFAGTLGKTAYGGDIDLNGTVNPADASVMGINWLQTIAGGWKVGDFDRNGTVQPADASVMGINWLTAQPGGAPGAGGSVPEPATMVLAVLGAVVCGWLIRRK